MGESHGGSTPPRSAKPRGLMPRSPEAVTARNRRINARSREILGQSISSANRLLLRRLTWRLLERLGETGCYRCKQPMSVETYSIDHLVPWRDGNEAAYWDLEKISFSHAVCNAIDGAKSLTRSPRRRAPEGQTWCSGHKAFLPLAEFTRSANTISGRHGSCRACRAKYDKRPRGKISGVAHRRAYPV